MRLQRLRHYESRFLTENARVYRDDRKNIWDTS